MIELLFPAFLLSIVLLGIHSYFGIEIIKRGIIFTDLAVGQMSAMGAAISLFFFEGQYLYLLSLLFALIGGLLIAFSEKKENFQEAFIGLLYAFSISVVFIILSKSPHGMEQFQELMASDILFTPLEEIYKVAITYSLLGLLLYFSQIKTKGFLKDIMFFVIFSATVTSSVKLAGVLTVFALLIAPALISTYIKKGYRLINAWIIGILINLISIAVSYNADLPTGYTIVMFHSIFAILSFFILEKSVKTV